MRPYLEYTIDDLKRYLESQFNKNMIWDNYGQYWHIDHVVPQFDLPFSSMKDDNFKQCWGLSNLRPSKLSRILETALAEHVIKGYQDMNNSTYQQASNISILKDSTWQISQAT